MVECLCGPARITSKELARIHSVKSGILQNACSSSPKMDADLEKSALYAHRQVEEQPNKRSKTNGDKRSVAMLNSTRQLGYGAAEVVVNLTEDLRHAETIPTCKIHECHCTSC